MPRRDTILARSLEPLLNLLWPLFLVWTVVIAILWTTGLDEAQIRAVIGNAGLLQALLAFNRAADTIWLLLAAANLYLLLAARVGLATARLWALIVCAASVLIALASVRTDWPLGSVLFTTRLGMKLGPVPLGWPLLWFVIVIGGRMLSELLLPRASHAQLAVATGTVALLTQINIEPLAWKVRLFWFWYVPGTLLPTAPLWRNHATWWITAAVLSFLLRERQVAATAAPPTWRPAQILFVMNAVFLFTHLAVVLRS